jgi:enoyl-CoA hydratase/carnithine racemase
MGESIVLVDKQDGIATVTLNRPDKLNALNRELRLAFCHTMQELRRDQDVRVVIITGASRAFCVGSRPPAARHTARVSATKVRPPSSPWSMTWRWR